MTEEEKSDRKSHAQDLKKNGNSFYQAGENKEAINQYNLALEVCPLCFTEDRAILMANKAVVLIKMDQKVSVCIVTCLFVTEVLLSRLGGLRSRELGQSPILWSLVSLGEFNPYTTTP